MILSEDFYLKVKNANSRQQSDSPPFVVRLQFQHHYRHYQQDHLTQNLYSSGLGSWTDGIICQ